jgi:hypothetical protein
MKPGMSPASRLQTFTHQSSIGLVLALLPGKDCAPVPCVP